jgi:hypothetical protein
MPAPIMSSQDAANLEPDAIAGDARDAETSRSLLARVGRWFSSSGGSSTGDAVALTPLEVRRMLRSIAC